MLLGILSGKEDFTDALLEEINGRNIAGLTAELCRIGPTIHHQPSRYRVILDRISHWIEYYRAYLKNAALTGTYVINNPFWFSADDKFFNYSLAAEIGVAVPRTVCLPSQCYDEEVTDEDLRNLDLPLRWEEITQFVGFPAILKPYNGYGWRDVYKVNTMDELLLAYEESAEQVMVLQEYIDFEHYVRAFVVGRQHVLPIKYDPFERSYIIDHRHLSDELGLRVVEDCLKLNHALGYDFNTVELAIRDGIPYAIDFMNPVPECKPEVITPEYFQWVVDRLASVMIDFALEGATIPCTLGSAPRPRPHAHNPVSPHPLQPLPRS
ncbi:MAG TPA: hypothetical protein VGO93_18665 [Candidatus Xenobia bacterium]